MGIKAMAEIVEDGPVDCDTLALRGGLLTMSVCFTAVLDGGVEVFVLHFIGLGVGGIPFIRIIPQGKTSSHKR